MTVAETATAGAPTCSTCPDDFTVYDVEGYPTHPEGTLHLCYKSPPSEWTAAMPVFLGWRMNNKVIKEFQFETCTAVCSEATYSCLGSLKCATCPTIRRTKTGKVNVRVEHCPTCKTPFEHTPCRARFRKITRLDCETPSYLERHAEHTVALVLGREKVRRILTRFNKAIPTFINVQNPFVPDISDRPRMFSDLSHVEIDKYPFILMHKGRHEHAIPPRERPSKRELDVMREDKTSGKMPKYLKRGTLTQVDEANAPYGVPGFLDSSRYYYYRKKVQEEELSRDATAASMPSDRAVSRDELRTSPPSDHPLSRDKLTTPPPLSGEEMDSGHVHSKDGEEEMDSAHVSLAAHAAH